MSVVDRRDIFVTTKLWNEDIRQGRTKEAFLQTLEDMGLDYIDLYLIHWPAKGYEKAWQIWRTCTRLAKSRQSV
mgnify:CR=1 FL=1